MVMVRESRKWGKCALCEKTRPLVEDVCEPCALWAQAMDKLADAPADHPAWDRLLRDVENIR